MIIPDVNILVYAFRSDTPQHSSAKEWLEGVRRSPEPLGLPDTVLTGFLRVVTNRKIFSEPAEMPEALSFTSTLQQSPNCRTIHPSSAAWDRFAAFAAHDPYIVGNLVPDAWLASIAISSGARLATADAGFARFERLKWFNPVRAE